MEIKLTIESCVSDETQVVDVSEYLMLSTVCDEVTLYNVLSYSMVIRGQGWSEKWNEIIPLNVSFDGQEIDIHKGSQDSVEWLWELSQLVAYLEYDNDTGKPSEGFLAYLYGCGWKFVDFEDIESWTENFMSDGDDKDEYAMTYYEDKIPDEISSHVDWDSVGEELFQDFTVYEFNGKAYYFNE